MPLPQSWAAIRYGDIEFELRGTKSIKQEAVHDPRGNYLFTRWTLEFSAILNPSATSYAPTQGGNGQDPPIQLADQFPAATCAAIREYLMQPRRKVVYRNGSQVLLECPMAGSRVDSEAGPVPEVFNVVAEHGTRTYLVDMRITCSVNEGWRQNALLSHIFSTKVHYDQDWQPVIITRGVAVFDANVVQQLGTFPDGCRSSFLHPVAPGCRRETVTVEALEDGNTVGYEFVDRWQDFTIDVTGNQNGNGPGNVFGYPTRFEAVISAGFRDKGILETEFLQNQELANMQFDALADMGRSAGKNLLLHIAGSIAGAARARMHAATARVPTYNWRMVVKCWGNAYSNRWDMICWACSMIQSRQPLVNQQYSTTFHITEMLHTRYIEVELMQQYPAATTVFGGPGLDDIWGARTLANFFGANGAPVVFGVFGDGPIPVGTAWTLLNFNTVSPNEMGAFGSRLRCNS